MQQNFLNSSISQAIADYARIILGLVIYAIGFTCFMLPYNITSGGVSGICALIYYATGFHANISYLIINGGLVILAICVMGWKYCIRTIVATLVISTLIGYAQDLITYVGADGQEHLLRLAGEEKFMACVIGGLMEGMGLAIVFMAGGSTGGTDIIASCVNKYWNISLGRMMLYLDLMVISCSYFVFKDNPDIDPFATMVTGYVTMFISMNFLDFFINGSRQSVQFTIISNHQEEIAQYIGQELERGITILYGEGWYSREQRRVLLVMAKKQESRRIFKAIHRIDPRAFVTMSNVEGVFGEGFDVIKK